MHADLWFKNAVVYSLNVETFLDANGDGCGDFEGLSRKLDYLNGLGVDTLWLAPFQPTPGRDDGYDITDHLGVDPRFGTSGDFVEFMHEAGSRGIRVIVDLVVNHTSDRHPWFKDARSNRDAARHDWYVWSDKRPPDWDIGMVFPGVQRETWSYERRVRHWYFHRFYDFEPDLNMSNPAVREEVRRIIGYWLELGVAGFRVDAVPFVLEKPSVDGGKSRLQFDWLHDIREFLQWRTGNAALLGEANVMPEEAQRYFADGDGLHMMFNFWVNQHLFAALATADAKLLGTLLLAGLLAFGLSGAYGRSASDPGVTPDSIVLGGTVPLSGDEVAYAAVARGAEAYFKYVNARGGVRGRQIKYLYVDDAYSPAETARKTRELVQDDKVFAIFNSVGTEHVLAVRPYLNQLGVPQLFVGSGLSALALEHARYPWSMGYLPRFAGEGALYGRYLARTRPRAKIAVLHEDSEYGEDMFTGLRRGLGKLSPRIKAVQTYKLSDADLGSQIARLKASGADTLMIFALPTQTIQAFLAVRKLGWRPRIFVNSVSIDPFVMEVVQRNTGKQLVEGAISSSFLKDPTDPALAKDPGVKLYKQILRRYLPSAKVKEVAHLYGMAVAYTMVDALRGAGPQPSRASLLRSATHLDERTNPFFVKGIPVQTGPNDYYPIQRTRMLRFHAGRWRRLGALASVR